MSKRVYTEEDIYEGMVLECVYSTVTYFSKGSLYKVSSYYNIRDNDDDIHGLYDIVDFLNKEYEYCVLKVVEPEEKKGFEQLFKYVFGIKDGDVEEISVGQGDKIIYKYLNFNKKHITIPAYNTQQAIEYLTNELDYDINDIVSMEVK